MKYPDRRPIIAVIGASSAEPKSLEMAEQVGSAIGYNKWNLITGGGGGVMEAACRGFSKARIEAGQVTIGILPTDDAGFANRFVDIAIPTGIGLARNAIIVRTAWGLVAVGGCSGTLSEIAFAWQLNRPIVALADSGGWAGKLAGQAIDHRRSDAVFSAKTADEALEIMKSRLIVK